MMLKQVMNFTQTYNSMRRIVFTAILLMTSLTLSAQPHRGGDDQRRGGGGGGRLHTLQCEQIITIMQMDETKGTAFREIYLAYNEAMAALRTPPPARGDGTPPSEEVIEEATLNSIDISIKVMELKREYYTKFRTILKPSEIDAMYRTERKIRDRAIEELFQRDRR